ncbi:MAG TPA: hypothetical protein VIY54_10530 [Steroidobacteraceae bacterium]
MNEPAVTFDIMERAISTERLRIYQVLEVLALITEAAEGTDHFCALQLAHDTLGGINEQLGRIESKLGAMRFRKACP